MENHRTGSTGDTIQEAMKLMDPDGILVPGTIEYKTIKDMIVGWIDKCGPDYALDMAEAGAEHLERWQDYL